MKSISFEPIINSESKILILGTMPGIASLKEHQYYAYKWNAFWPIMFKLFETDFLHERNIESLQNGNTLLQ